MQVIAFDLAETDKRERYDRLLAACPDAFIQQSTYWADVIRDIGPDRPIFLLAVDSGRDVGGLPLYLYSGGLGPILTSVPQAGPLGGVVCRGDADREQIYSALLAQAESIARTHDCVALTVITNPLSDDIELYRRHAQPSLVYENFTQVLAVDDIVRGERLSLATHPGRNIRKAKAAGLVAKACSTEDEFDKWFAIHAQRHCDLGLQPLRRELLHRIWRHLGQKGCSVLLLAMDGETIAAGGLFVLHQQVWDMFMMNTDGKYWHKSPNYLLVEAVLLEMKRRGGRFLNWQSSARRNDGVYRFKAQWGSIERPYFFVTRIFRDDDVILRLGPDGARKEYPNHFLVPFGVFDTGRLSGTFAKG